VARGWHDGEERSGPGDWAGIGCDLGIYVPLLSVANPRLPILRSPSAAHTWDSCVATRVLAATPQSSQAGDARTELAPQDAGGVSARGSAMSAAGAARRPVRPGRDRPAVGEGPLWAGAILGVSALILGAVVANINLAIAAFPQVAADRQR
jgi:hypothetical protein